MTLLALIFCFLTINFSVSNAEEVKRLTHTKHIHYKNSVQQQSDVAPQQQKSIKGDELVKRLRRQLTTMPLDAQRALLDIHNEYRSQVALGDAGDEPRAKNMNFLRWDEGLATIATNYATECVWAHNGQREQDYRDAVTANGGNEFSFSVPSPTQHFAIGENLYITSVNDLGTGQDLIDELIDGIELWFEEHLIWDYDTQTCTPDDSILPNVNVCGHYTQMAWAKTRYIGCGYHQCPGPIGNLNGDWYDDGANLLVCNYYFAGNYIGQIEYEKANNVAEIRSNCEADTGSGSQHWGGLCSGCPNPDYPDTQTSPSSCDDGLGRSTFAPTVARPPTPATPAPTVRPTQSPTDPTVAPTDRPTFANGNLEASGFYPFSNINLNGIWLFASEDANNVKTYTYYDSNGCNCNLYLRYEYNSWCTVAWYVTEVAPGTQACTSYWTRWIVERGSDSDPYPAVTDNQPGNWGSSWPGIFISIAPPTNAGTTPQPTTPQPTTPQPTPVTPQPTPQPTPSPTPEPVSSGGTRSCSYVSGIRYNGDQLGPRLDGVLSREDCCAYCIADTACVAMKYNTNNDRCWLLSQKNSQTTRSNFESADIVVS